MWELSHCHLVQGRSAGTECLHSWTHEIPWADLWQRKFLEMGSKVNTRDYVGSRMVMYTRRFNVSRWQSPDLAIAISPMQIITYSCLRKYTWRFNITEWQCADLHIAISTMQIYTGAKCWGSPYVQDSSEQICSELYPKCKQCTRLTWTSYLTIGKHRCENYHIGNLTGAKCRAELQGRNAGAKCCRGGPSGAKCKGGPWRRTAGAMYRSVTSAKCLTNLWSN